jgi:hypothetical protein
MKEFKKISKPRAKLVNMRWVNASRTLTVSEVNGASLRFYRRDDRQLDVRTAQAPQAEKPGPSENDIAAGI